MHQRFHLSRIILIILTFLFIITPIKVGALVSPTNEFYVNDYANILSDDTEKYILEKSVKLHDIDGTQIVVVTVKDLEGKVLEEYATELFRKFGIGDKKKNNGLLLLVSLKERKLRIEVGYGLEGVIPDSKAGRFRDQYMIPYLKDNKWDEGIKNGYDAFYKEIVKENNLNLEYTNPSSNNIDDDYTDEEYGILGVAFFISLLIGILARFIKRLGLIYIIAMIIFCVIFEKGISGYSWFITLFGFFIGRFSFTGIFSSGGGYSGGGWSSGGGGFSGGGGSSGGGGASGSF